MQKLETQANHKSSTESNCADVDNFSDEMTSFFLVVKDIIN